MDFRSLLQSMTSLSEAETKVTKTGKVHKGDYGTSYDGDDEDGKKKEKASGEKRGRGRPKKGADDSGEVKSYDTKTLGSVFGGGKKPKKEIGKVSKKHSLKEYMESAEQFKKFETVMEGMFGGDVDHSSVANNLAKLARVIKSVETPEQFAVAQKYAQRMSGTIMKHQHDKMGFGSGMRANIGVSRDIQKDLAAKARELGIEYKALEEEMTSQAPVQIKPASQTNTQVIQQGDKTLGTVNNPQLAAQIKQSIGKGEMTLNPNDQEMDEGRDEGKPGKNFAKIAKSAGAHYGSKAAGERVAGAVRAKLAAQGKLEEAKPDFLDMDKDGDKKESFKKAVKDKEAKKKVDESISLAESPATMQHIISKFKHEVKNFINGDELDHDLYQALYDYYADVGAMPYQVGTGKSADPYEWVTQRFDQDVHDYVVSESDNDSIRQHTQHGLDAKPSKFVAVDPNPPKTPWKVDPIERTTQEIGSGARKAFDFIRGTQKESTFEGKNMKDLQVESWSKQLNGLLNEGITVSSSQGQQGAPDSVTITATDGDSEQLLNVLRQAGIGVFGGNDKPEIGYGVAQGGEEEFDGTGTEPQTSPDVVGDGDDMLALIKKMTGLSAGPVGDEQGSQDYEDEEGEEAQTLEPADSGDEETSGDVDSNEDDADEGQDDEEEQTDEGNAFTGKLKQTPKGGEFKMGDKSYKDTSSIEEGHDENCNECGYTMEQCECEHEQVEENFANSANDPEETELAKLKALLSMGGDLHKMKRDQTVGNPTQVSMAESLAQWKKLSGI